MVLFPISEGAAHDSEPIPIWKAIEAAQKQTAREFWIVTQPSHAALAGDLAAVLRDDLFGPIEATVSRSIALHDAGWSLDDAEQIQSLRANAKTRPKSFLEPPVEQVVRAWTGSIETAAKFAPVGGYLVSRHFERLSQRDDKSRDDQFERFRTREKQRQRKLMASLRQDAQSLERLVDALQFCDVLSLYFCCGSGGSVKLQKPNMVISRVGGGYKLEPNPFKSSVQLSFSALRHPPSDQKSKSGATFYVNL